MDGVLVDSQAVILESLDHALTTHGLSPVPGHLRFEIVGPPLRAMLLSILGRDAPEELIESCASAYRAFNDREGPHRTPVFDGIKRVLQQLECIANLIVVTSKRESSAELVLEGTELRRYFTHVFGSPNDGAVVEKSETLKRAMNRFENVTVLIGDRYHDIDAAHNCGIQSIGVAWGYASENELLDARAGMVVNHPVDLLGAIKTLNAIPDPS